MNCYKTAILLYVHVNVVIQTRVCQYNLVTSENVMSPKTKNNITHLQMLRLLALDEIFKTHTRSARRQPADLLMYVFPVKNDYSS